MTPGTEARAEVHLIDRRVGTLGYTRGNTWFTYEDLAPDHPVLGQAFEANPRRRSASGTVPEWFANLLPEPGSRLRTMVARQFGRADLRSFALLVYLGEDLPGAVRIVDESRGDAGSGTALPPGGADAHEYRLRFSLAGVQVKFSMRHEDKALVLPATGRGGDWIVKLPDRRFPSVPENEYAMLTWARASGIAVSDIELVQGEDLHGLPRGLIQPHETAFATRRFDRSPAGPIHQEDFAQIRECPAEDKYARTSYRGIARVIARLCPPEDVDEYLRRLAAMVVMGNVDAHLKNWTLRYPDGRTPRLSPAYDLVAVSAYPEFASDALAFAINGGRLAGLITLKNFRTLAAGAGLDPERAVELVSTTVRTLADTWPSVVRACPVPAFVRGHIDERLRTLPLVREVIRNKG